jgi:hypothetical protein
MNGMSDKPRKVVLPLLGIAALAALFLTGVRTETPFQQAVRQLRIGMTSAEAKAAANIPKGMKCTVAGGLWSHWVIYSDRQRKESLALAFEERGNILEGHFDSRLVDWKLSQW